MDVKVITNANCRCDRMTGSRSMAKVTCHLFGEAVSRPRTTTFACLGFVGHATMVNPSSHGPSHAIHGVRDHAASDPAAVSERASPELLAAGKNPMRRNCRRGQRRTQFHRPWA